MPRVSVILTSFNHEKYLREAIDSVINQSFEDFELIIWDDCSADNSWEVIRSFNDSRIVAYQNRRNFGGGNINRALEVASGEYVAIHHSDDVWELGKLAKQVEFLDARSEIGAVFTSVAPIDESGCAVACPDGHYHAEFFEPTNRKREEWLNHFFYLGNSLCHPSVVVRKICFSECGIYRPVFRQLGDFDMWVRLCMRYQIHVLEERLVRFRLRDNESNSSGNTISARTRTFTEFYQILKSYRAIGSYRELVDIFPKANVYERERGCVPEFVLAMMALDARGNSWTRAFGVDILFEIMADPCRAGMVGDVYGFDHSQLADITGRCSIFLPD